MVQILGAMKAVAYIPILSAFTIRDECLLRTRPTTRTVSPTDATGLGGSTIPPLATKNDDVLLPLATGSFGARYLDNASEPGFRGLAGLMD